MQTRDNLIRLLGTNDPALLDPNLLPTSDISAISQTNPQLDGQVVISFTNDPTQNLSTSLEEPVDTEVQQSCLANGSPSNVALFDVGRGGAPRSPDDALGAAIITETWTPLPEVLGTQSPHEVEQFDSYEHVISETPDSLDSQNVVDGELQNDVKPLAMNCRGQQSI